MDGIEATTSVPARSEPAGGTTCRPPADSKRLPCDACGHPMEPEHAHYRCPACGYIQPCCGW